MKTTIVRIALVATMSVCLAGHTFAGALSATSALAFDTPYLTFRSSSEFTLKTGSYGKGWDGTMEYSTDTVNWEVWDGASSTTLTAAQSGGEYFLYLRGTDNTTITAGDSRKNWTFPAGSDIYCEGDIETLRQYDTGRTPKAMAAYCYVSLFEGCTKLKSAPTLSATTLTQSCYYNMFKDCTALVTAPALPATTLAQYCYYQMFYGCTSLTTPPPTLPATTLLRYCYQSMFNGCTSLATAPTISATTLASDTCCVSMFKNCRSLVTAPELHAAVLTAYCYKNMFEGCTSLTTVPELTATTLASQCYKEMFKGCTALVTAPAISATTLAANCCENMFYGCTKLEIVPDFPDVTLQSQCYQAMFFGCTKLEIPPALPATTLATYCYYNMFYGCTSLITMPKLEATTVPSYAYQQMFQSCTSLQVSTELTPGKKTWKLPAGLSGGTDWNKNMLASTGGSFKSDPVAGTTYYIVSMDSTELSLSQNEFAAWTGDDVDINLASTIVGGSMTYTFPGPYSTSPYSLPAGLTLTSGGALTGSISTAGTYDFIVKVQDTTSPTPLTLDAEYRIVVTDPDPITAPGANLGKVRVGKEKNFTLSDTVAGGVAPYTFTLASGVAGNALPAGYEIVNGVLAGTATEENTYTFTLTVKDKLNVSQNFEYTLVSYIPVGLMDDDPDEPETGDSIEYVNTDGSFTRNCSKVLSQNVNTATVVTWEDGWYYVTGTVDLPKGAIVRGKVSLILCDGATLNVTGDSGAAGISVTKDGDTVNTLTIYSQTAGTGRIVAKGGYDAAGIGGYNKGDYNTGVRLCNCGKVIIYGGVIEAKGGGSYGAGIGGGKYGNGGTVKIYGGDVSVTPGTYASGIGGGGDNSHPGKGGDVEVYGGTVTAIAQLSYYAGIGSYVGDAANQGSLKVGPYVTVKAGTSNPPTTVLERGVDGAIDLGTGANHQYFLFEATGPASLAQIAESATLQAYTDAAVNWNLASTITGGTTPYTFAIKEWTGKPSGISLSNAGVLTGTFTAAGVHTFTVTVTDSGAGDYARSDDFEYTITVTVGPKSITYKDGETTLTELSPSEYTPGTAVNLAAGPEKTGYTFDGWFNNSGLTGDAVTAVSVEETTPLTFWAKYTPIVYSVTYKDGDTAITDQGLAPTSYTIESETLNLPATATKSGKGFYGWYTNSTCTGSEVTTIPHGSTENKTFWAKWGPAKSNEPYIDGSGNPANVECATLDADTTTLSAGWYIAKGTLEFNSAAFSVSGDVKLILADGATLTVNGAQYKAGINVPSGSSLTIYCQSTGTGALAATGGTYGAGIGGNIEENCGTVTIYGGTITATGGSTAAGIGGGYTGAGGTVAVYGGTVVASANGSYAGIGGYYTKSQGSLTVGEDIVVKAGSSTPLADGNIIRNNGDATTVSLTTIYKHYALEVYTAPPIVRTGGSTLEVYANQAINWDIAAGMGGGISPLSYALSGQPTGVSLVNGVLTGSVAAADTYNFTVTVTDSASPAQVEPFAYTLTVVAPDPIVASGTDLGTVKVGAEKSFNLGATVSGGVTPCTFALVGSAPAGFAFNAETGVLSGEAESAGDCSVTIRVTDAVGTVESFTYSFAVVATGSVEEGEPAEPSEGVIVQYKAADGSTRYRMATPITSGSTTWNAGWYYVGGNVEIPGVTVASGEHVCLILGDGATLTATGSYGDAGVRVSGSASTLTIYGQGNGTGSLIAQGGSSGGAGIGGSNYNAGGTVHVYGGNVTASGGISGAKGIGAGNNNSGDGSLYIHSSDLVVKAGSSPNPTGIRTCDAEGKVSFNNSDRYVAIVNDPLTPLAAGETNLGGVTKNAYASKSLRNCISGGRLNYGFAVKSGSALPTGLSLNSSTGIISGTPTVAGSYTFWVTVTDAASQTLDVEFSLKVNDIFSIIYYESDGTTRVYPLPATYEYVEGTGIDELPVPTKTAYDFLGWYEDKDNMAGDSVMSISASETGNKTFYAKWAATGYTITYKEDNTDNAQSLALEPSSYTIESGEVTLPVAEKDGWYFDGWYDNTAYSGSVVLTIPANSTGDRTFYAKWEQAGLPLAQVENELFADATFEFSVNLVNTISGGKKHYAFALKEGSSLPAGVSLSESGVLSGTVATAGSYTFTVTVTDSLTPVANTIDAEYTLDVDLAKTTGDGAPDATFYIGFPASLALTPAIRGGTGPYTFELVPDGGELPSGLVLNGNKLEGTLTMKGNAHFFLNVTDANGVSSCLRYWVYSQSSTAQLTNTVNGIEWSRVTSTPPKENARISIWNSDSLISDGKNAIPANTAGSVHVPDHFVVLTDTITCIGRNAFKDCAAITRVTLPSTVTDIGEYAFGGCSALTSVVVPSSVVNINTNAFAGSAVTNVYVAASDANRVRALVAASGYDVSRVDFVEAEFLALTLDANFGDELEMPELTVVSGVAIGNLPVPTRYQYTFDGWYTEKSGGTRVDENTAVCGDTTLYAHWSTTLPDPVFTVNYKGELTGVTLNGHTEIVIPDTVTAIGDRAIDGLRVSANKTLLRVAIPDTVKSIGWRAFAECTRLREINIPEGVTNIDMSAFELCCNLESVQIPGSVEAIGNYAFMDCSNLVSVTIGNGVKSIGQTAFGHCTSLSCDDEEVGFYIPDSVESIGSGAFRGVGFEKASLPGSLYSEGSPVSAAFSNADLLKSVDVIYRTNHPTFVINSGSLTRVYLNGSTEVVVPDGVTEIWTGAFSGLSDMTGVTIPNTVTNIKNGAFTDCTGLTEIDLPDSLVHLGRAFGGCTNLKNIVIPDSVTEIDEGCFGLCDFLESVTIGSGVTEIPFAAFSGCSSLETVTIRGNVTSIGRVAFSGCSSLLAIELPDSLDAIGGSAFYDCASLASVRIPKGVDVGDFAFSHCSSLKSVNVGGTVVRSRLLRSAKGGRGPLSAPAEDATKIGSYAFSDCGELEDAIIGSTVDEIGGGAFGGCSKLKTITVEAGNENYETIDGMLLTSDGKVLVSGAGDATSVSVPSGVTNILEGAFAGFGAITNVTLPNTLQIVGEAAFSNCTALATATIQSNVTSIAANAFYGTVLATVHVEAGEAARVRALISGSGYDTAGVTFIEDVVPSAFTVTFDANGGTVAESSRAVNAGAAVGTLPTPTRHGYRFVGWFTAAEGGTQIGAAALVSDNVTYYAHWAKSRGMMLLLTAE